MGIEDPGWGKIIIVFFFIAILIGILYLSKFKGKEFFSQISGNKFLNVEETISLSTVSKASIITAYQTKFLVIHGKSQSPSILSLPLEVPLNENSENSNESK